MKRFISKTLSLLLAAVMALSLAACGGATDGGTADGGAAAESAAGGESTASTQPAGNSGEKIACGKIMRVN